LVITRILLAYAFAVCGDRSEKGAMPPGVWQPAHFSAKIGATFLHVGVGLGVAERLVLEPAAMAVTPIARAAAASTAGISRFRFTAKR
jgi:hypothetical protein